MPQIRCLITLRIESSIISIDSNITDNIIRSLVYSRKSVGPRMEPWGTLALTGYSCEDFPSRVEVSYFNIYLLNQSFLDERPYFDEIKLILPWKIVIKKTKKLRKTSVLWKFCFEVWRIFWHILAEYLEKNSMNWFFVKTNKFCIATWQVIN